MSGKVVAQLSESKASFRSSFKHGLIAGFGWSFGVSIGFVIISTIGVYILGRLGGLPLIGNWIAALVEEVQYQLQFNQFLN